MCASLLCLATLLPVTSTVAHWDDEKDPADAAFDHFRDRYELYSTIGDLDRGEFRSIRRLSLSGSAFEDGDAPHLVGLESLERLDLSGTGITDAALQSIGRLPVPLRTLDLSNTAITDDGFVWLAFLPSLEEIDLTGTAVTDRGIVQTPRFKGRLRSLTLGAGVGDEGLSIVPDLEALERLRVTVDGITPKGMASIASSRSIRALELTGESLSREMLARIATMEGLESLVLRGFAELGDSHLESLVAMPSLTHLDLSGTAITDAGLAIVASVPNLDGLVLSDTGVTDAGMKHLGATVWIEEGDEIALRTATTLSRIELARTAVGDRGLMNLAGLPIATLDLSGTRVTNGCKRTLDGWKLESFTLRGTSSLTDLSFVAGQPELRMLDLSRRKGINSQIRFLDEHPSLEVLDVSYTDLQDAATMPLTRLARLRQLNVAGTGVSLESLVVLAALRELELVNVRDTNILVHGRERRESLPGVKVSRSDSFPEFDD